MTNTTINEIDRILKEKGIRPSPVRTLVYRILDKSRSPLSVQDMEMELETVDRSSISRCVGSFHKAGIIHAISDGSGTVKYELCRAHHSHSGSDEHVHFRCELCQRTICLSDTPIPHLNLPDGFFADKFNFVVTGICDRCQSGKRIEE